MYAIATAERTLGEPVQGIAFLDPLEFIYAEHDRQRVLCNALDAVIANPRHGAGIGDVRAMRDYLRTDFPLHLADEEEDLFPRLVLRCTAADPVEEMIALLCGEHDKDRLLMGNIEAGLDRLATARPIGDPEPFFRSALAFTETQRRHAVWENQVLLPLARRRFSAMDLAGLGQSMAARRGIPWPG